MRIPCPHTGTRREEESVEHCTSCAIERFRRQEVRLATSLGMTSENGRWRFSAARMVLTHAYQIASEEKCRTRVPWIAPFMPGGKLAVQKPPERPEVILIVVAIPRAGDSSRKSYSYQCLRPGSQQGLTVLVKCFIRLVREPRRFSYSQVVYL